MQKKYKLKYGTLVMKVKISLEATNFAVRQYLDETTINCLDQGYGVPSFSDFKPVPTATSRKCSRSLVLKDQLGNIINATKRANSSAKQWNLNHPNQLDSSGH